MLAVAVFLVVLTVLSIAGLAVYMGGKTNTHSTHTVPSFLGYSLS
jgi:hypothetical protein